jgi:hypothetical protein
MRVQNYTRAKLPDYYRKVHRQQFVKTTQTDIVFLLKKRNHNLLSYGFQ